jgi:hypothetical protein
MESPRFIFGTLYAFLPLSDAMSRNRVNPKITNHKRRYVMCDRSESRKLTEYHSVSEKVDAAGWAMLFIWIGIVPIANIGSAISFLGIGIIIWGTQAVRRIFGLRWEAFRTAIGFLFIVGGTWKLFHIQLELFPLLCIAAGVAVLAAVVACRPRHAEANTRSRTW